MYTPEEGRESLCWSRSYKYSRVVWRILPRLAMYLSKAGARYANEKVMWAITLWLLEVACGDLQHGMMTTGKL